MNRSSIIRGASAFAPKNTVSSRILAPEVGSDCEWVYNHLGCESRRFVDSSELTSDIAAMAADAVLHEVEMCASELDFIILATSTPDQFAPATACKVQRLIKANNAFSFDVNAVCSGTVYALNIAHNFIRSGQASNGLVIGADIYSTFIDFARRDACFFGDGAGAVVLSATSEPVGFQDFKLFSDPDGFECFQIEFGVKTLKNLSEQTFYQMDGAAVFQTALEVLPPFIINFLKENDMGMDDIDLVISHQPSKRLLDEIFAELNFDASKAIYNFEKYANTASATVAMACANAFRNKKFQNAKNILFFSIGAGWTWGAALYKNGV